MAGAGREGGRGVEKEKQLSELSQTAADVGEVETRRRAVLSGCLSGSGRESLLCPHRPGALGFRGPRTEQ